MYDRRPADVPRTSHHLVSRTFPNWVPRRFVDVVFVSPVKNSNISVKQGLLHLKKPFPLNHQYLCWFPKSPLKIPWRSRTIPGRCVPAGNMVFIFLIKCKLNYYLSNSIYLSIFCPKNGPHLVHKCRSQNLMVAMVRLLCCCCKCITEWSLLSCKYFMICMTSFKFTFFLYIYTYFGR